MTESDQAVIVANCGLVCSECEAFVNKGRCEGCFGPKPMNTRCKIKKCNAEKGYQTCAECTEFDDLKRCRKLNNLISKFFSLIFRTDRFGNLQRIRQTSLDDFKADRPK